MKLCCSQRIEAVLIYARYINIHGVITTDEALRDVDKTLDYNTFKTDVKGYH